MAGQAGLLVANADLAAAGGWAAAGQPVCVLPLVCNSQLPLDSSA